LAPPDRELLRNLADWPSDGHLVTSLYVDVDGRRHPRRADVQRQADALLRRATGSADRLGRQASLAVCRDAQRMRDYLADEFDRRGTRGLALFSCSPAGLWQEVRLSQPVRDRSAVRPHPYVLPLEAVVERAETFCTALVDRARARLLVSSLGEIHELSSILDEVPGQHDQGGWAQARHRRHIEDHVQRHLKHVAEALLRVHRTRRFEHLVLSGPEEVVAELERHLHDYLRRRVVDRAKLSTTARAAEVLDHALAVEEATERRREEETVGRLVAESAGKAGRAVAGLDRTLEALGAGRADTLIVSMGMEAEGVRCPACGRLAGGGARCPMCGSKTEREPDLVEEAVEAALRRGCRVETVPATTPGADRLEALGGIGALLRF
jgi:peptide chain release factor subunit 1